VKSEKRQDVLKREKAKNDVADHHLMKLFEENVHKGIF
jgi:hypothetical protein